MADDWYIRILKNNKRALCICYEIQQDGQGKCDVTLRGVRANIVGEEEQWVLHNLSVCIFSLRYPACYAHAPYFHLWPALFYSIFPLYLISGPIKKKKLLNTKCVFWYSLQLSSATFLILRRRDRDKINVYIGLHVKYLLLLSHFPRQIFEKSSNIKFRENPSSGSRVVAWGQ